MIDDQSTEAASRRSEDEASLRSLLELLEDARRDAGKHSADDSLISALKSQGALAKYSNQDRSIKGMSLNHQKRIAGIVLGHYEILDAARKAARSAILSFRERELRGKVRSKARMAIRVSELEEELRVLRQDMFILQRAFDIRCLQARRYAAEASLVVQNLCAKEQKEIVATLSLRQRSSLESNVVSLDARRERT